MSHWAPTLVYLLCLMTSVICAGLLLRAWRRSRARLLFWTAMSFTFIALNNLFLVADMVLFPDAYLIPARQVSSAVALGVLIYGFIWETEQ